MKVSSSVRISFAAALFVVLALPSVAQDSGVTPIASSVNTLAPIADRSVPLEPSSPGKAQSKEKHASAWGPQIQQTSTATKDNKTALANSTSAASESGLPLRTSMLDAGRVKNFSTGSDLSPEKRMPRAGYLAKRYRTMPGADMQTTAGIARSAERGRYHALPALRTSQPSFTTGVHTNRTLRTSQSKFADEATKKQQMASRVNGHTERAGNNKAGGKQLDKWHSRPVRTTLTGAHRGR